MQLGVTITDIAGATREYLGTTYLGDDAPQGRYVFLEVKDTVGGMDPETKAKIFPDQGTSVLTLFPARPAFVKQPAGGNQKVGR